jgi:hypothetical protein
MPPNSTVCSGEGWGRGPRRRVWRVADRRYRRTTPVVELVRPHSPGSASVERLAGRRASARALGANTPLGSWVRPATGCCAPASPYIVVEPANHGAALRIRQRGARSGVLGYVNASSAEPAHRFLMVGRSCDAYSRALVAGLSGHRCPAALFGERLIRKSSVNDV